ncbi:hypothetical protein EUGRSUZ_E00008 [Eucalyptus grandis]|uniref:Uncharacterized protein n=1 Tax=Eucalyptus grandis TaxID=71139 RepID=A0ACC3KPV8_EUCGR|nr:hypothetical protein EUGRSUZ_E00008 [Eucalyptus grandis]
MAGGSDGEETNLEYTPTWVVAVVCSVIVTISLTVERLLHYTGKYLKKKKQKPLFDSLLKDQRRFLRPSSPYLMLLGFISLLLTVFQSRINTICISQHSSSKWLPCKKEDDTSTTHFQTSFSSFTSGNARRLLAEASASTDHCAQQGKVPLLSATALHHLHIFIFVLVIVHVTMSALTILFAGTKIRQWKPWEDALQKKEYDSEEVLRTKFTRVQDHAFIKGRFLGIGKNSTFLGWLQSFFKQFYASVTKDDVGNYDYMTIHLGFIMTHCRGNPKFNFHKYMIRALEADFKKVVGISWYLWIFVVIFLLLMSMLLLAVGTKLEHVINQLAQDVAEKHAAVEGDLVVQPSDDHFWFHRPRIVLLLIHILLFQNAFELAFFFFICVQYSSDSCIMGQVGFIIPRLVIGVSVQFMCSYSTLPLYAIVTQMGSSFKKAIFEEHIHEGLSVWTQHAKMKKNARMTATGTGSTTLPVDPKVTSQSLGEPTKEAEIQYDPSFQGPKEM